MPSIVLFPSWMKVWRRLACAAASAPAAPAAAQAAPAGPQRLAAQVDRVSWGVTPAELARAQRLSWTVYLQEQLRPRPAALPPAVQARIDALSITRVPARDALLAQRARTAKIRQIEDPARKLAASRENRMVSRQRANETMQRAVWLALYSPNQLQEQMTWFWMNHFSAYEDQAIRPHALGKFRDLLAATARSPAMLIYLDNIRNSAGHINENYARELLELHTLGVQGGYSQRDVQELARVLTGVGLNQTGEAPRVKPAQREQLVEDGLFLFEPGRHDHGDKTVLGHTIRGGRGLAELDEALDLLARHPATARHVSRKLAQYFVADQPPDALVQRPGPLPVLGPAPGLRRQGTAAQSRRRAGLAQAHGPAALPAADAGRLSHERIRLGRFQTDDHALRGGARHCRRARDLLPRRPRRQAARAAPAAPGPGLWRRRGAVLGAVAGHAPRHRIGPQRPRRQYLPAGLAGIHAPLNARIPGIAMHRRQLLKLAAAAPLTLYGTRLLAAGPPDTRLLVVFMRGAYDAASLLVPTTSELYYESRPHIAIARDAAAALSDGWALHPAVKDSLLPFYQRGELAFVPFAGTDDASRSHFETQNRIELGRAGGSGAAPASGFLNRLAAQLDGKAGRPAAFTEDVPQIFRGQARVPNIDLGGAKRKSRLTADSSSAIAQMYQGTGLDASVNEGLAAMGQARAALEAEMREANGGAGNTEKLEQEARRIGTFMAERYNLGFVDVGGWDTHVGQGAANGVLATKLGQLGRALAAYAQAMGPAWRHTTVVVISEFGRTLRENGNKGTDHGHGSVYWVLGGGVRGGRIAGEQVAVKRDTLFQDRDYPVLTDYRALFAGLFGRLYGLDAQRLQAVFPGARPLDLKLV
ncbi:PF07394 family protein [Bordetella pertussis STO1-CNMC-0004]|nr:PF07394 family protein [Bordetella pertussis I176]ETI08806.1 PF07394 family protein [Bordetella pertussis STO1-CNMC-0004]